MLLRIFRISFKTEAARNHNAWRRDARQPPTSVPLQLDILEDRCLPSLFAPFTPFPVGTSPESVAVGNFQNISGNLDLAVANFGSSNLSVVENNLNGGFFLPGNYKTGSGPFSVAVGDFNLDGVPDLAVANVGSNTVSVLMGDANGDGNFHPAVNYPVGSEPESVAVGDFNRDGIPDLAVANFGSNNVSVLLGNVDGTFQPAVNYAVGSLPTSVAVGDFNHDGILDLAVANESSGTVSVLLGGGDGTFQPAVNYPVGSFPGSVAVGDFRHDGTLDLAVTNLGSDTVSVLLGDGDGTFQHAVNYTVGSVPNSVAVGDFNRDGFPDLVVTNEFSNTVSVLLGNGDGTFGNATNYPVGTTPTSVAVGDFNHDGVPDLAVTASADNAVDILLNQSAMTSTLVTTSSNPSIAGQLVTFTATVTQAAPTGVAPTGPVYFADDNTLLGGGTLRSDGTATISTFSLGAGEHPIRAVYAGDSNFSNSISPVMNLVVDQDATTTALNVSANPVLAGQPLTLTAIVVGVNPGFGLPTGAVLFMDGPTAIGSGSLSGGVATFTTAALAPGNHPLSAIYVGDLNFSSSTSAALTAVVNNPAPAVTSLTPATLPEGSAAFTLTVAGSNLTPGAVVDWNGTPLTVVSANGTQIQAGVSASLLAEEGTALVTVTNPGPGGGTSIASTFTIADAGLATSRINLNVFGNLSFSGAVATFTDSNAGALSTDFTAIIIWDDKSANYGTISGTGPFTVSGTHTFATFGTLHTITVKILDTGGTAATVTDNVIDPTANEEYVMRLYQELLQRPPDAGGLAFWSGLLDQGTSRTQVALGIEQSPEYRQNEVRTLYSHYLNRSVDPSGLAAFTNLLTQGGTLEQAAADIVTSPEYFQTRGGGTNAVFLSAVYQDALGRTIDPSGQAFFGNRLAAGTSRGQITSAIFASTEYRQDIVQGYYLSILGRSADKTGLAIFISALAGGKSDEEIMADIFGSDEFLARL
jgi:hypothetical protein